MLAVNFFIYIFMNFATTFHWSFCLDRRFKRINGLAYAFIVFLILLPPSVVKFFATPETMVYELAYYAGTFLIVILLFAGYSNPIWQTVLFFVIWVCAQTVSELLAFSLGSVMGIDTELDYSTVDTTVLMTLDIVVLLVFVLIYSTFWNKIFSNREVAIGKIWMFGFVPMSHCFLLLIISNISISDKANMAMYEAALMLAVMLLDIMAIIFILYQIEKRKKKHEIEKIEEQITKDFETFEKMKRNIDDKAKLQHDYKNQLVMIRYLLNLGKYDESREACEGYRNSTFQ